MGADSDPDAVLDSRFRVRGVARLRVVDASIFPSIPGYFIVTNIYMASEKAADVLLEDAKLHDIQKPESERTAKKEEEKYVFPDSPVYPRDLREREVEALRQRRSQIRPDPTRSEQGLPDPVDLATKTP